MLDLAALSRSFSADGAAVLAKRWPLLQDLCALLDRHRIGFSLDRTLYDSNRLYAAVAFHHQGRFLAAVKRVVSGEMSIDALRESSASLWAPLGTETFAAVHTDDLERLLTSGLAQARPVDCGFEGYVRASGLLDLVRLGVGFVLVDEVRSSAEAVRNLRNYTDDFHLFTVHTDLVSDVPAKTGEAVVHESGHNLLNVFLEARRIELAAEPLAYYSPWTQSLRHHRGIVHGFFVFCLVTLYYLGLRKEFGPAQVEGYIAQQCGNLADTLPSVRQILASYPRDLADLVENVYSAVEQADR